MKKILIILFLAVSFSGHSQNIQLSPRADISIITCGPTQEELYSAFGHSAIRIYDPELKIDYAFNYGIFDFNQPNFYLNFTRGHLNYKLGVHDYQRFKNDYIYRNRFLHEQILNLTIEQKQKIFDYLQWNALPENEYYLYDYFYNNCSTKIRDVIVEVLGKNVVFDGSYIKTNYSIRELTDLYLKEQPWGDLGIDIGLGLPMDKKASPYEYMFLPDYLESGFDHATIIQNDKPEPIVKANVKIYQARDEEPKGLPNPVYVFSVFALAAIALSISDFKKQKITMWFDGILFSVTGLLGWLLFLLWVATDHKAAANNMNLLWALPTHLIVAIAFIKQPAWIKTYFLVITILSCMILVFWFFLPQKLHYSLVPMVIAIAARAFTQFRLRK